LNATFANGDVTLAPTLTGSQPAIYTQNGVEVRPFRAEKDAAFTLCNLLDASQQQKAIIGSEPIDMAHRPGQDGGVLQPTGIVAAELSAEQQTARQYLIRPGSRSSMNRRRRIGASTRSARDLSCGGTYGQDPPGSTWRSTRRCRKRIRHATVRHAARRHGLTWHAPCCTPDHTDARQATVTRQANAGAVGAKERFTS